MSGIKAIKLTKSLNEYCYSGGLNSVHFLESCCRKASLILSKDADRCPFQSPIVPLQGPQFYHSLNSLGRAADVKHSVTCFSQDELH